MSRARLGRYAVFQLRDYLMGKAVGFVLFSLFVGSMIPRDLTASHGAGWRSSPEAGNIAFRAIASQSSVLLLLGLILSASYLVANDRVTGSYRFLFAKPVGIPRYYAQLWLVHGAGFVALTGLLLGLFSVAVVPVSTWPFMAWAALLWALWGSICFCFSTFVRFDWLMMTLLMLLPALVKGFVAPASFWYKALTLVLPPVAHLDAAQQALVLRTPVAISDVAWVVGYGAIFLMAGLVSLRRRPIGA